MDDRLTAEVILAMRKDFEGVWKDNPPALKRRLELCDLALSALRQDSSGGVHYGYGIVGNDWKPYWSEDCVCQDSSPLQGIVDEFNEYKGEDARVPYRVVELLAARAEPGAQINAAGQAGQDKFRTAPSIAVNLPFERVPQHAGDPGYGPMPPESNVRNLVDTPQEGHAAGPVSAAPEPAAPQAKRQIASASGEPVTAAAPESYSRYYAGHARGFAEGLEEGAMTLVHFNPTEEVEGYEFRGDDGDHTPTEAERILLTDFAHGLIGTLVDALRAKIKPAKGEL